MLGDEHVGGAHRLRAGAAHAEHAPVIDDLVLAPRDQAHAVIDDALAVSDRRRQHVPLRGIDTATEVPEAADDEPAVDAAALPLRIRDPRRDQRVGIRAPHVLLGALVVEREHPVMHAEVCDVPAGRGAAPGDLGGNVEQRHELDLHAAPAAGLVEPEEAGAMEIVERLLGHLAAQLARLRPLAQDGHERAGPPDRLVVAHPRKAGSGAGRMAHARASAAFGISEYISPPQSFTSFSPKKLSSIVRPFGSLRKTW